MLHSRRGPSVRRRARRGGALALAFEERVGRERVAQLQLLGEVVFEPLLLHHVAIHEPDVVLELRLGRPATAQHSEAAGRSDRARVIGGR